MIDAGSRPDAVWNRTTREFTTSLLCDAAEARIGLDARGSASRLPRGVGFDPRCTEKWFDTFYTTKHDGMGIGRTGRLVLVRDSVLIVGGRCA